MVVSADAASVGVETLLGEGSTSACDRAVAESLQAEMDKEAVQEVEETLHHHVLKGLVPLWKNLLMTRLRAP